MAIGRLPTGSKGFDCDFAIDTVRARAFFAHGYRFAIRYVGRTIQSPHDASSYEVTRLRLAGLAVMLVQHVRSAESWDPQGADLGALYGRNAALFAKACGYQAGAVLWCDLEGVASGTPKADVIAYCNAWHDAVASGGYDPGLYVGWHAGLTAHELYYRLRFTRYWSAYNLNRDQFPAVRGVQLRQHVAGASDRVPGVEPNAIDVNIIGRDALGDSPILMLATGDR